MSLNDLPLRDKAEYDIALPWRTVLTLQLLPPYAPYLTVGGALHGAKHPHSFHNFFWKKIYCPLSGGKMNQTMGLF